MGPLYIPFYLLPPGGEEEGLVFKTTSTMKSYLPPHDIDGSPSYSVLLLPPFDIDGPPSYTLLTHRLSVAAIFAFVQDDVTDYNDDT